MTNQNAAAVMVAGFGQSTNHGITIYACWTHLVAETGRYRSPQLRQLMDTFFWTIFTVAEVKTSS